MSTGSGRALTRRISTGSDPDAVVWYRFTRADREASMLDSELG